MPTLQGTLVLIYSRSPPLQISASDLVPSPQTSFDCRCRHRLHLVSILNISVFISTSLSLGPPPSPPCSPRPDLLFSDRRRHRHNPTTASSSSRLWWPRLQSRSAAALYSCSSSSFEVNVIEPQPLRSNRPPSPRRRSATTATPSSSESSPTLSQPRRNLHLCSSVATINGAPQLPQETLDREEEER